jgi:hypothetical protein
VDAGPTTVTIATITTTISKHGAVVADGEFNTVKRCITHVKTGG